MNGADKAELIIHPIRLRILQSLARKPMTTAELDKLMPDVAKSSLYRHVKKLLDGGMIEVEETHLVKGTPEKTYRLIQAPHITQEDINSMTKEDHLRYFSSYVAGLVEDFKAYLNSQEHADMVADRAGYGQSVFYASTEELDELFKPFQEKLVKLTTQPPQTGRRLRKLVIINHPEIEER